MKKTVKQKTKWHYALHTIHSNYRKSDPKRSFSLLTLHSTQHSSAPHQSPPVSRHHHHNSPLYSVDKSLVLHPHTSHHHPGRREVVPQVRVQQRPAHLGHVVGRTRLRQAQRVLPERRLPGGDTSAAAEEKVRRGENRNESKS